MCPNCKAASEHPSHTIYCPTCIYCGARLIKRISNLLHGDKKMLQARMRKVLKDWKEYGHSEDEIRRLVKHGPLTEPEKKRGSK